MPASVSAQPPVFVINLDSSPERYQHAEQQLLALGITPQRYAAVYGKDLTPEQVAACYDQAANLQYFRRSLSPGELGCYLSHRGIWQKMVDEQIPLAIVLEDDIDVDPRLPAAIQTLRKISGWDHIKLSDDRNTPPYQTLTVDDGFVVANFKRVPNCATGYAVSLEGAKKMLVRQRIYRPVDIDLQLGNELQLQLFSLLPYTIWPSARFDSVIDAISGGSRKGDTTFWRNLKYRISMLTNRSKNKSGSIEIIKISKKSCLF